MRISIFVFLLLQACEHRDSPQKIQQNATPEIPTGKLEKRENISAIQKLSNGKEAPEGMKELLAMGDKAFPLLEALMFEDTDVVSKGWGVR